MTVTQRRPQPQFPKSTEWLVVDEFSIPLSTVSKVRVYFASVNCLGCIKVRVRVTEFNPPQFCGFVNSLNSGYGTWPDSNQWKYFADFTPPTVVAARIIILAKVQEIYYQPVYYIQYWGADVTHEACVPKPELAFSVLGNIGERLALDIEPRLKVPVKLTIRNRGLCNGRVKLRGIINGEFELEEILEFEREFTLTDEPLDLLQEVEDGDDQKLSGRALIRPANFVSLRRDRLLVRAGAEPPAEEWRIKLAAVTQGVRQEAIQITRPETPRSIISPRRIQNSFSLAPRPVFINESLRSLESVAVTSRIVGALGILSRDMVIIMDGEIKGRDNRFRYGVIREEAEGGFMLPPENVGVF